MTATDFGVTTGVAADARELRTCDLCLHDCLHNWRHTRYGGSMPKISVDLSDEELDRVNKHARSLGVSTRSLAKQLLISNADRARFLSAARTALPTALEAVKDAPEGLR